MPEKSERVFPVNRGINKAVEFKGLKAQYIWWVGAVVMGCLVLYGILYFTGVNSYLCVPVTLGSGAFLISRVLRMSKRFGQYGMMKWSARRGLPKALVSRSRKLFIDIRVKHGNRVG